MKYSSYDVDVAAFQLSAYAHVCTVEIAMRNCKTEAAKRKKESCGTHGVDGIDLRDRRESIGQVRTIAIIVLKKPMYI